MTEEEKQQIRSKFYSRSRMPNVIGCVDGTHVGIIAPHNDKHLYLNRKGFFSINAMIACDYDMNIRCVDARYAGSTHDSFVWNNSSLNAFLQSQYENGDQNSIYLGESEIFIDAVVPSEPVSENSGGTPGERRRREIAAALL
ncbi:putative nuclease HARBI1 [Rhagoletis pomonella]|uniref:putative nuclease HARBI1 n=1 Tax=Rhagoletis pomonella TaxID=28610 RepID=UPI001785C0A2|nr:putative nuclease HARBI1 [Rhagoletis pomonella]